MSEERFNLTEDYDQLSERFGIDKEAYPESAFENDMKRYVILQFKPNPKKEGLIAYYQRKITFLDWNYSGEPIESGDHVLCTIKEDLDYNVATPVMKITPSILLGISNEMREAIINALWDKNKKDYVGQFEQRYKNETYEQAKADAEAENKAKLDELNDQIESLKRKLAAANFAMDQASFDADSQKNESEDIELSSEPVKDRPEKVAPESAVISLSSRKSETERPIRYETGNRVYESYSPRVQEMFFSYPHFKNPIVKRVGPRAIYSESFEDGRYFVHVSPNKKLMLIRKHDEGEVFCVNHQVMIQDLERLYPFLEEKDLKAERSGKYDGILVHLDL
ncbi:hypothetical protein AUP07_0718 [methanogenic archaeon mixed culture ISO4-G1]|nr:hypothetical protein AUP07_0718 [methanogenic archaeon mixed culture ISO4-G1]